MTYFLYERGRIEHTDAIAIVTCNFAYQHKSDPEKFRYQTINFYHDNSKNSDFIPIKNL